MKKLLLIILMALIVLPCYAKKAEKTSKHLSAMKIQYRKKEIILMLEENNIYFQKGSIELLKKAMYDSKYRKTLDYQETMQLITLYYLIIAQSKILDLSNTNDLILNALKKMIMIGENKKQNENNNK